MTTQTQDWKVGVDIADHTDADTASKLTEAVEEMVRPIDGGYPDDASWVVSPSGDVALIVAHPLDHRPGKAEVSLLTMDEVLAERDEG